MSWAAILVLAAGSYGFKLAGVVIGNRLTNRMVLGAIGLLPAALFTAVIALQTVVDPDDGTAIRLDARLVGLAVAVVAAWRKLPFAAIVLLAVAATAITRALFG